MKPSDWVLMAVAKATKPMQPVQLQKALFLIGKRLPTADLATRDFYRFDPYDYGPFCGDVYTDAEALEQSGLLAIRRPPETRYKLYTATPEGQARAAACEAGLTPLARAYLANVIQWVQSLTFDQLVGEIYRAYPEMKVNSVFQA